MITTINSLLLFVALGSDLYCQGCGKSFLTMPKKCSEPKGVFGVWAARLVCANCNNHTKSPFMMCRICTRALFKKESQRLLHRLSDAGICDDTHISLRIFVQLGFPAFLQTQDEDIQHDDERSHSYDDDDDQDDPCSLRLAQNQDELLL